jgi:hypothetical protein
MTPRAACLCARTYHQIRGAASLIGIGAASWRRGWGCRPNSWGELTAVPVSAWIDQGIIADMTLAVAEPLPVWGQV